MTTIPIDFWGLTSRNFASSLFKYASIFILMYVLLTRISKTSKVELIGLTIPSYASRKFIKVVLLILFTGGILPKLLFTLNRQGIIEGGPQHWFIFDQNWGAGFWAFMMIGSIIIPPLVEEIFFRGYMQGRLHRVFSPGLAIFITASTFTLFHTQYLLPDPLSLLLLISLFVSALILSYSRWITGSIIPGMVAHALVNIPFNTMWTIVWLITAMCLLFVWRNDVINHFKNFYLKIINKSTS